MVLLLGDLEMIQSQENLSFENMQATSLFVEGFAHMAVVKMIFLMVESVEEVQFLGLTNGKKV
jgi:hypothetical protein